jgi:protein SCO1/2
MRAGSGLGAFVAALALALACERGPDVFEATGVVEDARPDLRQVVIDHEDIPGLMPAMTMSFDVADPALLEGVEPGQRVRFRLSFDGRVYRVLSIVPEGAAGAAGVSGGSAGGAGLAGVAAEAEPAPPFELADHDGQPRSLASLRGKVVLLDFVWANCPGPCPILTGTHVRVQKILPPEARERVWFASVTLDPERDTPAALRQYATQRGADLATWSFLTGTPAQVEDVIRRYGVGTARLPNGEIQHVVVTFLIDAEGRIAKRYFGLEHHADDLARDLAAAAAPARSGPPGG